MSEELRGEVAEAEAEAAFEEAHDVEAALAVMEPTLANTANGQVRFTEREDGILVHFRLQNIEPGTTHGIHIHEEGDCSAPDGTSAGGHYAPEDHDHALPEEDERHAGDMGNVTADENGNVSVAVTFDNFSLDEEHPVLNRAVILHEGEDTGGQPTGEAGARIACGVIRPVPGA